MCGESKPIAQERKNKRCHRAVTAEVREVTWKQRCARGERDIVRAEEPRGLQPESLGRW